MASRGVSLVWGPEINRSGLDFRQSSVGPAARVSRDHGSLTAPFPAFPACCGPPYLSAVGEPDDPGSTPTTLLLEEGILDQLTRRTQTLRVLAAGGLIPDRRLAGFETIDRRRVSSMR